MTENGPIEGEGLIPAIQIIDPLLASSQEPCPHDLLIFCYTAVLQTIKHYLEGNYTYFDGHTTTNCCHGMAFLTHALLLKLNQIDLSSVNKTGQEFLQRITADSKPSNCQWEIPVELANLVGIYLLACVKEVDPMKGGRTSSKKLKSIAPISTNKCNEITHRLQKGFSNWIAERYAQYFQTLPSDMIMSGAPIQMWGKYVQKKFLRIDKRGLKYASNLYSVQIILASLIIQRKKVVLINDIWDADRSFKSRYCVLFEGDGNNGFRHFPQKSIEALAASELKEPVFILGGCAYNDQMDIDQFKALMQPWKEKLNHLILACDVYYPQFFKVKDDPDFDSAPITPEEERLQTLIKEHKQVQGVSSESPSFYCGTHIFVASVGQVLRAIEDKNSFEIPLCILPRNKHLTEQETMTLSSGLI